MAKPPTRIIIANAKRFIANSDCRKATYSSFACVVKQEPPVKPMSYDLVECTRTCHQREPGPYRFHKYPGYIGHFFGTIPWIFQSNTLLQYSAISIVNNHRRSRRTRTAKEDNCTDMDRDSWGMDSCRRGSKGRSNRDNSSRYNMGR